MKDGQPATGKQVAQTLASRQIAGDSIRYWIFLPRGYDDASQKWPVLLFLHGKGECGDDLELVKLHGPPKIVEEQPDFPFIVISPQSPEGRQSEWTRVRNQTLLVELIDEVQSKYRVDRERLYLTGLSMGGHGTWKLASRIPDRVAAIAPITGIRANFNPRRLKSVPIWCFHGAADKGNPPDASEEMVQAVTRAGGDVRFTVYPYVEHNCWTMTYANPKLYAWLLEHRKPQESPK